MQLRNVRDRKTPELIIIPMIDIMFFLLVFFMLSTMYMIDLKTIPVKLPQAAHAATDTTTTFAVSLKNDGSLYLVDYGRVIELIDKLKGAGITRFGLATDGAGK